VVEKSHPMKAQTMKGNPPGVKITMTPTQGTNKIVNANVIAKMRGKRTIERLDVKHIAERLGANAITLVIHKVMPHGA